MSISVLLGSFGEVQRDLASGKPRESLVYERLGCVPGMQLLHAPHSEACGAQQQASEKRCRSYKARRGVSSPRMPAQTPFIGIPSLSCVPPGGGLVHRLVFELHASKHACCIKFDETKDVSRETRSCRLAWVSSHGRDNDPNCDGVSGG